MKCVDSANSTLQKRRFAHIALIQTPSQIILEDVVASNQISSAKKIPQMPTEISMGLLITVKRNPI
jgi:hypothetical protein